jgi:hypothetical protein
MFDFSNHKFSEILVGKPSALRPPGMYGHSMNYMSGGQLYVFGGTSGFDYYKDIYRFDIPGH